MKPLEPLTLYEMLLAVERRGLLLLLAGLAVQAQIGMAQSAGTLTRTGDMTTTRVGHTATLLLDGTVLIAGGGGFNLGLFTSISTSSAELYDPGTGTFRQTGSMTTSRNGHTATLLLDGRVLIAGGRGGDPAAASRFLVPWSAELYDPKTGAFTPAGYMNAGRSGHLATLLRDGRVLFVGGANDYINGLRSEIYDPSTGIFTAMGNIAVPIYEYIPPVDTATLLLNGNVLVNENSSYVDGSDEPTVISSSELFDPLSGKFTRTGGLSATRWAATATPLIDGRVLVAGGASDYYDDPATAELYDPSTAAFAATGAMTTGRFQHSATLLADGSVFLAGGTEITAGITSELYDPAKGTFRAAAPLDAPREAHTSTLLTDGTVLIAGGLATIDIHQFPDPLSSAEIYRPPVLVPPPALLTLSGGGSGQGAILHARTSRVVSASDPAVAGELLEIYCRGLADGGAVPPIMAIGGRAAEVLYFGKSGISGVNQINVRVPSGVAPGGAVSVRMLYLGRPSNEVTIGSR